MSSVWLDITSADQNAWRGAIYLYGGGEWIESETDKLLQPASNIFKTKAGTYKFDGGRTILFNSAQKRVGILEGLNPDTAKKGDNRQGLCDETGVAFNWVVGTFGYVPTASDSLTTIERQMFQILKSSPR